MIALVTGANKGIGFETARALAEGGHTVWLGARDAGRGKDAEAELRGEGLDVRFVRLDVTDEGGVSEAAERIGRESGGLDVLVNNAATSKGVDHLPSEADLGVVRAVFDTNVYGVVRVVNAVLPLLKASAAGRIVNVSSEAGSIRLLEEADRLYPLPAQVDYPTSKAALNTLTVQYAKELQPHGIKVNAVSPGLCATDFNAELGIEIPRTAADGAAVIVAVATAGPEGATGAFFNEEGQIPW